MKNSKRKGVARSAAKTEATYTKSQAKAVISDMTVRSITNLCRECSQSVIDSVLGSSGQRRHGSKYDGQAKIASEYR